MRVRSVAPPGMSAGPDLRAAAAGIGARLVREAVWYRGHCNWIGADTAGAHALGPPRPAHRALGPSLGEGTAGVALFLAQLHAVTGNAAERRTALGAIGQALSRAGDVTAHGLYDGRPGIAYAAARCGRLLEDDRLVRRATRLAHRRDSGTPAAASFDVRSGAAGAIAALVALARLLGDERLVLRAAQLGDGLVAAARRERAGWSWAAPGRPRMHGLCGLAHGASGAAHALLELHALTGDVAHREAGERALAYERHWFDAESGHWPDLRGVRRSESRGAFRPAPAVGWCHGAPGIALTRLRAWQLLGDERMRDEAAIALGSTAADVERALMAPRPDFSLCHGLAGSADVLAVGAALLPGEAAPAWAALARRAGETGAGRYTTSLDGWPAGRENSRTPALLSGDAGIGLILLRLDDAAIPSPLLITGRPPR